MTPIKTLIMGAAGRDFHNFNVFYRDNKDCKVIAFTATQIPNIEEENIQRNWLDRYTCWDSHLPGI